MRAAWVAGLALGSVAVVGAAIALSNKTSAPAASTPVKDAGPAPCQPWPSSGTVTLSASQMQTVTFCAPVAGGTVTSAFSPSDPDTTPQDVVSATVVAGTVVISPLSANSSGKQSVTVVYTDANGKVGVSYIDVVVMTSVPNA